MVEFRKASASKIALPYAAVASDPAAVADDTVIGVGGVSVDSSSSGGSGGTTSFNLVDNFVMTKKYKSKLNPQKAGRRVVAMFLLGVLAAMLLVWRSGGPDLTATNKISRGNSAKFNYRKLRLKSGKIMPKSVSNPVSKSYPDSQESAGARATNNATAGAVGGSGGSSQYVKETRHHDWLVQPAKNHHSHGSSTTASIISSDGSSIGSEEKKSKITIRTKQSQQQHSKQQQQLRQDKKNKLKKQVQQQKQQQMSTPPPQKQKTSTRSTSNPGGGGGDNSVMMEDNFLKKFDEGEVRRLYAASKKDKDGIWHTSEARLHPETYADPRAYSLKRLTMEPHVQDAANSCDARLGTVVLIAPPPDGVVTGGRSSSNSNSNSSSSNGRYHKSYGDDGLCRLEMTLRSLQMYLFPSSSSNNAASYGLFKRADDCPYPINIVVPASLWPLPSPNNNDNGNHQKYRGMSKFSSLYAGRKTQLISDYYRLQNATSGARIYFRRASDLDLDVSSKASVARYTSGPLQREPWLRDTFTYYMLVEVGSRFAGPAPEDPFLAMKSLKLDFAWARQDVCAVRDSAIVSSSARLVSPLKKLFMWAGLTDGGGEGGGGEGGEGGGGGANNNNNKNMKKRRRSRKQFVENYRDFEAGTYDGACPNSGIHAARTDIWDKRSTELFMSRYNTTEQAEFDLATDELFKGVVDTKVIYALVALTLPPGRAGVLHSLANQYAPPSPGLALKPCKM